MREAFVAVLDWPIVGTAVGWITKCIAGSRSEKRQGQKSGWMMRRGLRRTIKGLAPGDYVVLHLIRQSSRDLRSVAFRILERSKCGVSGDQVHFEKVGYFRRPEIHTHVIPMAKIDRIEVHHDPPHEPHDFHVAVA